MNNTQDCVSSFDDDWDEDDEDDWEEVPSLQYGESDPLDMSEQEQEQEPAHGIFIQGDAVIVVENDHLMYRSADPILVKHVGDLIEAYSERHKAALEDLIEAADMELFAGIPGPTQRMIYDGHVEILKDRIATLNGDA